MLNRWIRTYERVPPLQVLVRHLVAVLVNQLKGTADLGPAHALGRVGHPLALHPHLLTLKVPYQPGAGEDEEKTGLP